MINEVNLRGLAHSPSDHEAIDGSLGTCLNLIPEDGALHPLHQGSEAESFTLPNDTCSIELVHKVTHDANIHSHYIVHCANASPFSWYWTERKGDGKPHQIDLGDFKVNAVTAVGNILCFVGDEKTLYAYWDADSYRLIDFTLVKYSGKITRTAYKMSVDSFAKDNTILDQGYALTLKDKDSYGYPAELGENVTARLFSSQDAFVNKYMDSYSFKYIQFGILAVQLYDGTYIQLGDPFMLAPKEKIEDSIGFFYSEGNGTYSNGNLKLSYEGGNIYAIYKGQELDNYELEIKIDNIDSYRTLIKGVDLFVSPSLFPYGTKGTIKREPWPVHFRNDQGNTSFNGLYVLDSYYQLAAANFRYQPLTEDDLYQKIDELSFFKSLSFSYDEVAEGKSKKLKRVLGTEESLPLANLQRASYGAQCAITYNNRLHLANVKTTITTESNNGYGYYAPVKPEKPDPRDMGNHLYRYVPKGQFNGNFIDNFGSDNKGDNCIDKTAQVVSKVYLKINNKDVVYTYYDELHYPLPPIVSFPSNKAKKVELFIGLNKAYYKKTFNLYESETFGFNYAVNYSSGTFCPLQVNKVDFDEDSWTASLSKDTSWTAISEDEFKAAKAKVSDSAINNTSYPNLVKVSNAENPILFDAKDSVQVGSSIVSALASNTQPISEGQFGYAPLYAFTDEGVWVLTVTDEGTYGARQPAKRDICSNVKGILQIDDAVLYPTEQGVMMQTGRESKRITDTLDGFPFDFTILPHADKVLAKSGFTQEQVKYLYFREFMKQADMIYDYYDSRIIIFNPISAYAYVFSLKSGEWGAMQSNIRKRVNIYPDAYAVDDKLRIIDAYQPKPTDAVPYLFCTRPLVLAAPDIHKTVFSVIARGYFRNAKGTLGMVLYASNDLFHWQAVGSTVDRYLRGMAGSPYKYFRIAAIGSLNPDESIQGFSLDYQQRWNKKLR